jgi:glycosidase
MEDFDHFLATAHDLGLKVIIDWVANHTSRDADWWKEGKKDWYVMDEATGLPIVEYDWTDIAKLNYNNADLRVAMIDALKFWIEKGVDGYRCDVAMNVPGDFWAEAWKQVRQINPDVYLLAEGEEKWLHEAGFEATYAWEFHHIMNAMAKGGSETKNVAGDGTIKTDAKTVADLKEYLARDDEKYPAPAMRLMFTSNHDENSWAGTEFERMGDAHKAFAALTFVLPKSQPLIYTGQEIGLNRRLQFFEKDSVVELVDLEYGKEYRDFYKALCAYRHNNEVLAAGNDVAPIVYVEGAPETVLAFTREKGDNKVLCVFNFSAEATKLTITGEAADEYYCTCCNATKEFKAGDVVELEPWGFMLLSK